MVKRFSTLFLAAVYFATHVAWAHAPETNLWEERRRSRTAPAPVAALAPAPILPALITRTLPSADFQDVSPAGSPAVRAAVAAVPAQFGAVHQVSLPQSEPQRVVLLVQDIHGHREAQQNIGHILAAVDDTGFIGLEGAFAPIDVSALRAFPDQEAVRLAADALLRDNRMSGAAHAALINAKDLAPMAGVDDPAHYAANVRAYRTAAPRQAACRQELAAQRAALDAEKARVFNPALKEFDARAAAHHDGAATLGDFLQALPPASHGPAIRLFLQALALEKSIDFPQVEKDRALLIQRLAAVLDKRSLDDLALRAAAVRTGTGGQAAFYARIKTLCAARGIPLTAAMDAYLRYVLAADRINAAPLFAEIRGAEASAYRALCRTDEERRLVARSRRQLLAAKLVEFALTPEEWKEYAIARFSSSPLAGETDKNRGENNHAADLEPFEAFYQEAEARNDAITRNLLRHDAKLSILVCGGFHAPGLSERLTRAGAAVVTVTPRVTKLDGDGGAYLSVFTREKTPLEKLFAGERLSVADNPYSPEADLQQKALTLAAHEALTPGNQDEDEGARRIGFPFKIKAWMEALRVRFRVTNPATGQTTVQETSIQEGALAAINDVGDALDAAANRAAAWLPDISPMLSAIAPSPAPFAPGWDELLRAPLRMSSQKTPRNQRRMIERAARKAERKSAPRHERPTPPSRLTSRRLLVGAGIFAAVAAALYRLFPSNTREIPADRPRPSAASAARPSVDAPRPAPSAVTDEDLALWLKDYLVGVSRLWKDAEGPYKQWAPVLLSMSQKMSVVPDHEQPVQVNIFFNKTDGRISPDPRTGYPTFDFLYTRGAVLDLLQTVRDPGVDPAVRRKADLLLQAMLVKGLGTVEFVHLFPHFGSLVNLLRRELLPARDPASSAADPEHVVYLTEKVLASARMREAVKTLAALHARVEMSGQTAARAFAREEGLTIQDGDTITRHLPKEASDRLKSLLQDLSLQPSQQTERDMAMRNFHRKVAGARGRPDEQAAVARLLIAIEAQERGVQSELDALFSPATGLPYGPFMSHFDDPALYVPTPAALAQRLNGFADAAPQHASFANQAAYTALWAAPFLASLWFLGHHPADIFAWLAVLALAPPTLLSAALTSAYRAGVMAETVGGKTVTTDAYNELSVWAKAAVNAEEAFHRRTTARDPRLNQAGFFNALPRAWDEITAKTAAMAALMGLFRLRVPWRVESVPLPGLADGVNGAPSDIRIPIPRWPVVLMMDGSGQETSNSMSADLTDLAPAATTGARPDIAIEKALRPGKEGGIPDGDHERRRGLWEDLLSLDGKPPTLLEAKGRNPNEIRRFIEEHPHALISNVVPERGIGGSAMRIQFPKYVGTPYLLEYRNGTPRRIFFEKDLSLRTILAAVDNRTRDVVAVYVTKLPSATFSELEDASVDVQLDRLGNLSVGGGRPEVDGGSRPRPLAWGRFAPFERGVVLVKDGVIVRYESLERDFRVDFGTVRRKSDGRILTSFQKMEMTDFEKLTENHEIHGLKSNSHGDIRFGNARTATRTTPGTAVVISIKRPAGKKPSIGAIRMEEGGALPAGRRELELYASPPGAPEDSFEKGDLLHSFSHFNSQTLEQAGLSKGDSYIVSGLLTDAKGMLNLGGGASAGLWMRFHYPHARVEAKVLRGERAYVRFLADRDGVPIRDTMGRPLVIDIRKHLGLQMQKRSQRARAAYAATTQERLLRGIEHYKVRDFTKASRTFASILLRHSRMQDPTPDETSLASQAASYLEKIKNKRIDRSIAPQPFDMRRYFNSPGTRKQEDTLRALREREDGALGRLVEDHIWLVKKLAATARFPAQEYDDALSEGILALYEVAEEIAAGKDPDGTLEEFAGKKVLGFWKKSRKTENRRSISMQEKILATGNRTFQDILSIPTDSSDSIPPQLEKALERLSQLDRDLLSLVVIQEAPLEEVAQWSHRPVNEIEMRLEELLRTLQASISLQEPVQHASFANQAVYTALFWLAPFMGAARALVFDPGNVWLWAGATALLAFTLLSGVLTWSYSAGVMAATRHGATEYKEAFFNLSPGIQAFVETEEAWHRRTTRRFPILHRPGLIGFLLRALDEAGAKTAAMLLVLVGRPSQGPPLGQALILSGPSGVGKTGLKRRLHAKYPGRFRDVVSWTTRAPRPGEVHGKDYFFVTREEFEHAQAKGEFLQSTEVHGNMYGTPVAPFREAARRGQIALADMNVDAWRKVKKLHPDFLSVFLLPPSMEELRRRLEGRGTETQEQVERRLADAARELPHARSYDRRMIADDARQVLEDVLDAVDSEGILRQRLANLQAHADRAGGPWPADARAFSKQILAAPPAHRPALLKAYVEKGKASLSGTAPARRVHLAAALAALRDDSPLEIRLPPSQPWRPLAMDQLRDALESARPGRPLSLRVVSPSTLAGYGKALETAFKKLEPLGLTLLAQDAPGAPDITLVQWQGSEREKAQGPPVFQTHPGKKIVLLRRPNEILSRYGQETVEKTLAGYDAVVVFGPSWLPVIQPHVAPGTPVIVLPHGTLGMGEAPAPSRLGPNAVVAIGAFTAWGELRDVTDLADLADTFRRLMGARNAPRVLAFVGGTYDDRAQTQLAGLLAGNRAVLLGNAQIRRAGDAGDFHDEDSFRLWLLKQADGKLLVRGRLDDGRVVPDSFAPADGGLFAWQEALADFKVDMCWDRTAEGRAVKQDEASGTLHRLGPNIPVVLDSPQMRDARDAEGLRMIHVELNRAGRPDFLQTASDMLSVLRDPDRRRRLIAQNLSAGRRLPMAATAFGYLHLARFLTAPPRTTASRELATHVEDAAFLIAAFMGLRHSPIWFGVAGAALLVHHLFYNLRADWRTARENAARENRSLRPVLWHASYVLTLAAGLTALAALWAAALWLDLKPDPLMRAVGVVNTLGLTYAHRRFSRRALGRLGASSTAVAPLSSAPRAPEGPTMDGLIQRLWPAGAIESNEVVLKGRAWPVRQGGEFILVGDYLFVSPDTFRKHAEAFAPLRDKVIVTALDDFHGRARFRYTAGHSFLSLLLLQANPEALRGKTVVDAGAGDGLLGTLALRLGAAKVIGIEIDANRLVRARATSEINRSDGMTFLHADIFQAPRLLGGQKIDTVLASLPFNGFVNGIQQGNAHLALFHGLRPSHYFLLGAEFEAEAPGMLQALRESLARGATRTDALDWSALYPGDPADLSSSELYTRPAPVPSDTQGSSLAWAPLSSAPHHPLAAELRSGIQASPALQAPRTFSTTLSRTLPWALFFLTQAVVFSHQVRHPAAQAFFAAGGALLVSLQALMLLFLLSVEIYRIHLAAISFRRPVEDPAPAARFNEEPPVTVQVPVYNELNVVEPLIESLVKLDYPRNKLQIQILDDSTDETADLLRRLVEEKRAQGHNIVHIHRSDRAGRKAGALAAGLSGATGDFVAIFDADFRPRPDFLRQTIDHFTDPGIAVVQAKWEYINRDHSFLTKMQASLLETHQVVDHAARAALGGWPHFYGSGGVWRKTAIQDAGGWNADTEAEDADLSYRAIAKGWRMLMLKHHGVPSELPQDIPAYLVQQTRWTRGPTQAMRKLLAPSLAASPSRAGKADALVQLTVPFSAIAIFATIALIYPVHLVVVQADARLWSLAAYNAVFLTSLFSSWLAKRATRRILGAQSASARMGPLFHMLLAIYSGASIVRAKAFLQGMSGQKADFQRTPKWNPHLKDQARKNYASPIDGGLLVSTALMGLYTGALTSFSLSEGLIPSAIFNFLYTAGALYVLVNALRAPHRAPPASFATHLEDAGFLLGAVLGFQVNGLFFMAMPLLLAAHHLRVNLPRDWALAREKAQAEGRTLHATAWHIQYISTLLAGVWLLGFLWAATAWLGRSDLMGGITAGLGLTWLHRAYSAWAITNLGGADPWAPLSVARPAAKNPVKTQPHHRGPPLKTLIRTVWPGEPYYEGKIRLQKRPWTVRGGAQFIQAGGFLFVSPATYARNAAAFEPYKERVIATDLQVRDGHAFFSYGGTHSLLAVLLLQANAGALGGRTVLDAGAGDGLLGTLALRLGAAKVTGIERTGYSVEQARRVAVLNRAAGMRVLHGDIADAEALMRGEKVDVILASLPDNGFIEDQGETVGNHHLSLYVTFRPRHYFMLGASSDSANLPAVRSALGAAGAARREAIHWGHFDPRDPNPESSISELYVPDPSRRRPIPQEEADGLLVLGAAGHPAAAAVQSITRSLGGETSLRLSELRQDFALRLDDALQAPEHARALRGALEKRGVNGGDEAALKKLLRRALAPAGKKVYFISGKDLKDGAAEERLRRLAAVLKDYFGPEDYLFVTEEPSVETRLKALLPAGTVLARKNAFRVVSIQEELARRGMRQPRFYASPGVTLDATGASDELMRAAESLQRVLDALNSMPLTPFQLGLIDRAARAIATAA